MRSAPAVWCCGLTSCSGRTASPPLNSSVRRRLSHMGKHLAIAFCAAVFPFTALASQSWPPTVRDPGECLTNPGVVAPCFSFHGRMSLANGSPSLRIWRIGTKRILGVLPSENPVVPTAIRKRLAFGVEPTSAVPVEMNRLFGQRHGDAHCVVWLREIYRIRLPANL